MSVVTPDAFQLITSLTHRQSQRAFAIKAYNNHKSAIQAHFKLKKDRIRSQNKNYNQVTYINYTLTDLDSDSSRLNLFCP